MDYVLYVLILVNLYAILAVSLNLLVGLTGLVSIAHAGFMAIGAYTTALVTMQLGVNFFIAVAVGMAVAAALSAALAVPSLKVTGDHYIIASFGFQVIIISVLLNWPALTNGPFGIAGIPRPVLLGFVFDTYRSLFVLSITLAGLCTLVAWRIAVSPFGAVLRAIREDESAARSLGKNVTRYKVQVFVVGCALAALGGGLYAAVTSFIDPPSFDIHESIFILAIVIIGGKGNVLGSFLGAVVLILLPEALKFLAVPSTIADPLRRILYGLLLIVFMRFLPSGLLRERAVH
ncbi:MAG: branched-chain amino acid ABC transporter permease [Candidatus Rokuibacteriota bacterium]